jgi:HEAT repeat protein/beta-lactamase regulating signal transducer with metallopeptidase domain
VGTVSLQRSAETQLVSPVARPSDYPERPIIGIAEQPSAAPASIDTTPASNGPSTQSILLGIWATIALALALIHGARRMILVGRLGDRETVSDGRLLDLLVELSRDAGLRTAPRLTTTTRISSPIALGMREICVPESALTELDLEQQRSMLAHELAHLARRDPLWMGVASLVECVLWFQPLNRVARRQIARAAEFLCDDWAVRRTGSGIALARCLAQVAEWVQASPLGVPVAGMAEERSLLVSRVARLLEGATPAARPRRALSFAAAGVLAATIIVAPGVSSTSARTLGEVEPPAKKQRAVDLPATIAAVSAAPEVDVPNAVEPAWARRGAESTRENGADSSVVVALIARLKDEDAEVRQAAAHSLGRLGDARAVPGLIASLGDAEAGVRAAAAEALGELEDSRAIPALAALLGDASTEVKQNALEALSQFDRGVPSGNIVRLFTDPDAEVRHRAAHLAGKLRDRSASAALATLVRDTNAEVRRAAIESLGELKDVSAAAAIVPALSDGNAEVRRQALDALEELRAPIPDATLIALMRDANPEVRGKAAELTGERSVVAAIPTLKQLLEDGNAEVRGNAIEALGNIGNDAAYEALRAALSSKDAKVRRAAAENLGERRP